MWVKVPMEYVSGAANYLDKYGPEEKYNVITHIANIECPVLAITGTDEVARRFAFDGLPDAFAEVGRRKRNLVHTSVPGGDHQYSGRQDLVLSKVVEWLEGAVAGSIDGRTRA
jgi:hypothetical protein